ncbi:orexin receptor type 1 isoform X1 [Nasonia vitripennis]|uniref:G-protein coupled receptors family 1 profile domain-containing protein n=1 Tax=Nasonia vitripennis TaxID=7425 RepID=A0A7M7IW93_NASVI|nr:orexin receptor type 1 isoform X1 [Nasonia vitripennis]
MAATALAATSAVMPPKLDKAENSSLDMAEMSEILRGFYEDFNSETNYLLIGLYVPVIILAMTANILVIIVVFKYQYMRSVTNYFVVNLSVADLLVTIICMPMAVSQAVSIIWVYGELMCKLFFYLQGVAVAASVFTITAMSIDRYLAIRSPIAFRRVFNRKSTIIVIAGLWIVALSIFAPVLRAVTLQSPITDLDNITLAGQWASDEPGLQMPKPPTFYVCSEDFKPLGIHAHIFGTACFVLVYAVPGFIVIMAYSMMGRTLCARKPPFDCDSIEGSASSQQGFRLVRERRRVAWILLLLAVLFALCWLPYNVLRLLVDLGVVREGRLISDVLSYCLFLGHANSALNPVVYCFMTRNFRRSVAEILCRGNYGLARRKPHRKWFQTLGSAVGVCAGCNNNSAGRAYYPKAHPGDSVGRGIFAPSGQAGQQQSTPGTAGPTSSLTLLQPGTTGTTMAGGAPTTAVHQASSQGNQSPSSTPAHAVLALRAASNNSASNTGSSSGYDSFYSRHSPHRRCYMLRSLPQDQERHKAISPAKECNDEDCNVLVTSKKSHRHSHSSRSSTSSSHSRIHRGSYDAGKQSSLISSDEQRFM